LSDESGFVDFAARGRIARICEEVTRRRVSSVLAAEVAAVVDAAEDVEAAEDTAAGLAVNAVAPANGEETAGAAVDG